MGLRVNENPADLEARELEVTPLNDFATMGLTDHLPMRWEKDFFSKHFTVSLFF
jgi:hypothetical protein